MIDRENLFDQPARNDLITYDNSRKIAPGKGNDYITAGSIDFNYFKNYYEMIAIDLSKQQAVDFDPKAMQQINFTRNLDREEGGTIFFFVEEGKETILDFSQGDLKVLWMLSYDLATACFILL